MQQQRRRRSVAAWADTWRIEMKCVFPGLRRLCIAVLIDLNGLSYCKQTKRMTVF